MFRLAALEKFKNISKEIDGATEKLKKQLTIEETMKIQPLNKLAEIMNRKDLEDNSKMRIEATPDDLRGKEKECRKLYRELGVVRTHFTRKVSVIRPRCTRGCLYSPPPHFAPPSPLPTSPPKKKSYTK